MRGGPPLGTISMDLVVPLITNMTCRKGLTFDLYWCHLITELFEAAKFQSIDRNNVMNLAQFSIHDKIVLLSLL